MNRNSRYDQAKKVTLIGAFINIFLGIIKLLGGFFYHSNALIADGIHSFSDLLTDFTVLLASKFGNLNADESHPYGHKRIETAATLLLSLFLILAGLGIIFDAIKELYLLQAPGWPAIFIAFFSIISNELSFQYTHKVGTEIKSSLIIANAWHHRSDAAASIIVAIGLIGSWLGLHYLDGIAAIIVGALIIKMGVSYIWNSIQELVDTAASPELIAEIATIIKTISSVKKIHQLRTRSMGGDVLIDVHVLVSPFISVSEGHHIAQQVHYELLKKIPHVNDVIVHIDPEDDELFCPSLQLPSRESLEEQFLLPLKKEFPDLTWNFHYLEGKIHLDLFIKEFHKSEKLQKFTAEKILKDWPISNVRLYYQFFAAPNQLIAESRLNNE